MTNRYLAPVLGWYASHARELPWRQHGASPWAILVSEVMLQQTPVARVLPAYQAWLARWPTPSCLAACPPGEAVRQWGRLGYPRRALRLHATARIITERHGGQVPAALEALVQLPGVGSYTAAAVASFAFGQRHAVLDTNVRRVLGRLVRAEELPARSTSAAEVRLAESLLPAERLAAARWSVAVMELGARPAPSARQCPVTKAVTGSAGAHCSPRSAAQAARSGKPSLRRPGRIISSGHAHSGDWLPTASRNRCRITGSPCPASALRARIPACAASLAALSAVSRPGRPPEGPARSSRSGGR